MDKSTNHMIRSINWNVQVGSYEDAITVNDRVPELSDVIGNVLDEVGCKIKEDDTLFIDQVTIDLGSVYHSELDELLREKFEEALIQQIRNYELTPRIRSDEKLKSLEDDFHRSEVEAADIVLNFLKKGTLPWWAENYELEDISDFFIELISAPNHQFLYELVDVLKNKRAAYRLTHQFKDSVRIQVVATLGKISSKKLRSYLKTMTILISSFKKTESDIEDKVLMKLAQEASSIRAEKDIIVHLATLALELTKGSTTDLYVSIDSEQIDNTENVLLNKITHEMNKQKK